MLSKTTIFLMSDSESSFIDVAMAQCCTVLDMKMSTSGDESEVLQTQGDTIYNMETFEPQSWVKSRGSRAKPVRWPQNGWNSNE